MVWRWRNQTDTGYREAQFGDVLRDLVSRQLATLAGLGALGHLDLNLFGRGQVFGGHTKTTRSDLFDLGAQRIACQQRQVNLDTLFTDDGCERIA